MTTSDGDRRKAGDVEEAVPDGASWSAGETPVHHESGGHGQSGQRVIAPGTGMTGAAGASVARRSSTVIKRTRISGTWVAVVVATVVLIFLLAFILQNPASATVSFLGLSGTLPLGVALLLAAISGALLVALVGAARILQLRRRVRKIDSGSRGRRLL